MTSWTWLGWPDPLVDFGRELYVPWQIDQGRVLYRDIAYFNGPLSPYFNALMFKIFGTSLRGLMLVNLGLLLVLVWLIWRLGQLVADAFTATIACIVLLTVFSFIQLGGIGNYNFIAPYSHEITHGIVLSFVGIACISEYLRRSGAAGIDDTPRLRLRVGWIGAAGMVLGLIFLTKAEVFVAAAVAYSVGVIFAARQLHGLIGKSLGIFAVGAIIPPVVAMLLLRTAMPASQAIGGVLGSWRYVFDSRITSLPFYQKILGVDDPATSARAIGASLLCYAIVVGAAVGAARLPKRGGVMLGMFVATVVAMIIAFAAIPLNVWQQSLRGLTILAPALAIFAIIRAIRRRDDKATLGAIIAVFATVLLGKSAFNVLAYHYGFALAMPAALVAVAAAMHALPHLLCARGRAGHASRVVILPVIVLVVFVHLYIYATRYADKTVLVGRGADSFRSDPSALPNDKRGRAVNVILAQLRPLPGTTTLAVIPDGVMINYLSMLPNPTRHTNLMPPEVLMYGQDRIIADFQANPPDVIILNGYSDASEYGFKGFTADYGADIWKWIQANYIEIPSAVGEGFPLKYFKRN